MHPRINITQEAPYGPKTVATMHIVSNCEILQFRPDLFGYYLHCLPHLTILYRLDCYSSRSYRNRKLEISRAPTKAKSRKPAYSPALVQNKIDRQRVRFRESVRQADSQTAMVDGV